MRASITRVSGRRSPTDLAARAACAGGRRLLSPAVSVLALLLAATPAVALDFFTLWQRPELPLNLAAGQWANYRRQALSEGRRTNDLVRIQCLGRDAQDHWLLEVLPLVETDRNVFEIVPGEGLRLQLTDAFAERRGSIVDAVAEVRLWRNGEVRVLDRREWRRDPLVTASFSGEFAPEVVQERPPTVRVIGERELRCQQLVFAAADTQSARLPGSVMIQTATQEVSAAVHPDIPLLGLAYASERIRAESRLEPPSDRLPTPPTSVRVEILECLGFGDDARPALGTDARTAD
jgi:hypothetical protein